MKSFYYSLPYESNMTSRILRRFLKIFIIFWGFSFLLVVYYETNRDVVLQNDIVRILLKEYCYVKRNNGCFQEEANSFESDNFKSISSELMEFLGMHWNYQCELDFTPDDVPVIVTGSSSNHFNESLLSLENLKNVLISKLNFTSKFRLVYYNLGLTPAEIEVIRRIFKVEMRDFPFEVFPEHVRNLSNFAWKPIIIRRMLYEEDFVMWVDTSIRFAEGRNTSDIYSPK